jgi:hypothetical protein
MCEAGAAEHHPSVMTALDTATDTPADTGAPVAKRDRRWILGARTALIMLLIAGVALVGIGVAALMLVDPPEVDGWLRSLFGSVFGYMAIAIGMIIGLPALLGVWAMSGATEEGATPALPHGARQLMTGIAITTLLLAALVILVAGSRLRLLDLALIGIVALPTLGLAGAVRSSPHRGRATGVAIALVALAVGIAWLLLQAWRLSQR